MDRWVKPVLSTDVLLIRVLLIHFFYVINVLSIHVTLVHVSEPYLITCLMPVERGDILSSLTPVTFSRSFCVTFFCLPLAVLH